MTHFEYIKQAGEQVRFLQFDLYHEPKPIAFLEKLQWLLVFNGICLSAFDEYQQVKPELIINK